MPDLRRYRVPGGCYFFTANPLERRSNTLLTDRGLYPLDWIGSGIQDVPASEPGE